MIVARENIKSLSDILRDGGQRIVFTNGCFDILHAGHVRYLAAARALGDCLVLGLNDDESVRRLKGGKRPINSVRDRAEVLDALISVDYVTIFGEATAETLVSLVRPDIYAKGGDYDIASLPEAKVVQEYGGRVALIDFLPGRSTTRLIEKIRGAGESDACDAALILPCSAIEKIRDAGEGDS